MGDPIRHHAVNDDELTDFEKRALSIAQSRGLVDLDVIDPDPLAHPFYPWFQRFMLTSRDPKHRRGGMPVEFERDPSPSQYARAKAIGDHYGESINSTNWAATFCYLHASFTLSLGRRPGSEPDGGTTVDISSKGWAYCDPGDKFNARLGRQLAMWRALGAMQAAVGNAKLPPDIQPVPRGRRR